MTRVDQFEPAHLRAKLGTAKGAERSRIWIEGKRLADAGFTAGRYYLRTDLGNERGPVWRLELVGEEDVVTEMPRTVSGRRDKPIIDITGRDVFEAFGRLGTHVDVWFYDGAIEIQPAEDAAHG